MIPKILTFTNFFLVTLPFRGKNFSLNYGWVFDTFIDLKLVKMRGSYHEITAISAKFP